MSEIKLKFDPKNSIVAPEPEIVFMPQDEGLGPRKIMVKVKCLQKHKDGFSFETPVGIFEIKGECPEWLENGKVITLSYEI